MFDRFHGLKAASIGVFSSQRPEGPATPSVTP